MIEEEAYREALQAARADALRIASQLQGIVPVPLMLDDATYTQAMQGAQGAREAIAQAISSVWQYIRDQLFIPLAKTIRSAWEAIRRALWAHPKFSQQTRQFLAVKCAHRLERARVTRRIEARRDRRRAKR